MLSPRWWLSRCGRHPTRCLGVSIGCVGMLTGGRMQTHSGVFEFHGGAAARFLDLLPLAARGRLTLGHTVIGRDAQALEITRAHERSTSNSLNAGALDGAGLLGLLRGSLAAGPRCLSRQSVRARSLRTHRVAGNRRSRRHVLARLLTPRLHVACLGDGAIRPRSSSRSADAAVPGYGD